MGANLRDPGMLIYKPESIRADESRIVERGYKRNGNDKTNKCGDVGDPADRVLVFPLYEHNHYHSCQRKIANYVQNVIHEIIHQPDSS
jgi:hypothetical protein